MKGNEMLNHYAMPIMEAALNVAPGSVGFALGLVAIFTPFWLALGLVAYWTRP